MTLGTGSDQASLLVNVSTADDWESKQFVKMREIIEWQILWTPQIDACNQQFQQSFPSTNPRKQEYKSYMGPIVFLVNLRSG